jgi:hypothetical protein
MPVGRTAAEVRCVLGEQRRGPEHLGGRHAADERGPVELRVDLPPPDRPELNSLVRNSLAAKINHVLSHCPTV